MHLNLDPKLQASGSPTPHKWRTSKLKKLLGVVVWLLLAAVLWFMQTLSRTDATIAHIPVIYGDMPREIGLEGEQPTQLDVSISAKGSQLLYRWMKGVTPITLAMPQSVPQGGKILFSNAFLMQQVRESLGSSIQIREIYPDKILLRAFSQQQKEVPIVSHISVSSIDGYMVLPPTLTPETVKLYGSREALAGINEVHTQKLSYDKLSQSREMRVPLVPNSNVLTSPDSVQIQINVVELTERCIELPVIATHTPPGFVAKILPARATLVLTMPISSYNKVIGDDLAVVVDLGSVQEALLQGKPLPEMLPVTIQGLPEWVVRANISPKTVQYILESTKS